MSRQETHGLLEHVVWDTATHVPTYGPARLICAIHAPICASFLAG